MTSAPLASPPACTIRSRLCPPSRVRAGRPPDVEVEPGAELLQEGDGGRRLVDQGAHGLLVAEPGTGDERVLHVQLGVVVLPEDGGQPALRPRRAAVAERALGDDGDRASGVRQRHRGHQPGGAAADDDDVGRARSTPPAGGGVPRPGSCHSPIGEGVPIATIASTAARARAAIAGSTVTSSRPSRSARSSFSGVDIFM